MSAMIAERAVRILAEREGWREHKCHIWNCSWRWMSPGNTLEENLPDYLNSRDALAPVLGKLTPEEWEALVCKHLKLPRNKCWDIATETEAIVRYCLTLPARDLAFAVAEAIEECGEKGEPSE